MEEEKLRLAMEVTIQQVLKNQQQVSGTQIPREMVNEILNRLPRKSLARFKSVCKLWSILIDFILVQRLDEEVKWRVGKFTEAKRTLKAVMDEIDRRAVDVDDLRAFHVRVMAKIVDVASVADFDQDYLNCYPARHDCLSEFRRRVISWVREAEAFLSKIDALLEIFLPLQEYFTAKAIVTDG